MNQVTVLEYWRVVWRARWGILALTVAAAAIAYGAGRLQPKVYTTRATILTPKDDARTISSLGAFLGGQGGREGGGGLSLPDISLGLPSVQTNEVMFVALLRSQTIKEEVLADFATTWGPSVGSMFVGVETSTREKGVIAVAIEATDPKLAADLANAWFQHLDRMLERSAERATRRKERFYLTQLERAAKAVTTAEETLLKFQTENRLLVNLDPATKSSVEGAASQRGFIMALEMQREILRMRVTDQHPQMRELQRQITELKRQYSQNLFGGAMDLPSENPERGGARKEFFVPAAKMTPVQFAFLRLFRNLKIQEAFYVAAFQGLEQIKYQDGVSPVNVDMLDVAVPPKGPSRPNVRFIVFVAAVSALSGGVLLALFLEYIAQLRREGRQALDSPVRRGRTGDGGQAPAVPGDGYPQPAVGKGAGVHAGGPAAPRPVTIPGTRR